MHSLIDTHFHLDHYRNYLDIARNITNLKQYTICVTNSPGIFCSCKRIINETKYLKFAIGFHPLEPGLGGGDLAIFFELLCHTNYIGEIGLDFLNPGAINKENQLYFFDRIIQKSAATNKLVTIHIRKAEAEAINILRRYLPGRCIIHWFSGTEEQLYELIDLGCYFSINSNMLNGRNKHTIHKIPIDRILVESDGPYTKVNGRKYTPELLQDSYVNISSFYGLEDIREIVFNNFSPILS